MSTYRFSGHETFHCRGFWLKKGLDFQLNHGHSFASNEAIIELGVGKNMVTSINHWMKAFGVKTFENELTSFGKKLLSDGGFDPYMEDQGSLWLLHYELMKNNEVASIYKMVFNDFRKNRVSSEFTPKQLFEFIERKCKHEGGGVSEKVLNNDIKVFIKNYVTSNRAAKSLEDDFSAILLDLNLLSLVPDVIIDGEKLFKINYDEKERLPELIFLYTILDKFGAETSVSFKDIQANVSDKFLCNREGTEDKLQALQELGYIVYKEDAGRKEIQFKKKLNKWKVLEKYYG